MILRRTRRWCVCGVGPMLMAAVCALPVGLAWGQDLGDFEVEPAIAVNFQGRDREPAGQRAYLSSNFPWLERRAFEAVLDQSYYYSDEDTAYLSVRLSTRNLVRNGTFERDTWRRGWPDDWSKSDWQKVRRMAAKEEDPTSACVRLGPGPAWVSQEVGGIKAGVTYELTLRASAERGGRAEYQVSCDAGAQTLTEAVRTSPLQGVTLRVTPKTDQPIVIRLACTERTRQADAPADALAVAYFAQVRLAPTDRESAGAWPVTPEGVRASSLRLTVDRVWAGKTTLQMRTTMQAPRADTTLTHAINMKGWPSTALGRSYRLSAELMDAQGKPVPGLNGQPLRAVLTFGRIEPPKQVIEPIEKLEWRGRFACSINGRPFFPLMLYNWYDNPDDFTERDWQVDLSEMRKMGFNTLYMADRSLARLGEQPMYFLMCRPSVYVDQPGPRQLEAKVLDEARRRWGHYLLGYADHVEGLDRPQSPEDDYRTDKAAEPQRVIAQGVYELADQAKSVAKGSDVLWVELHEYAAQWTPTIMESLRQQAKAVRQDELGMWCDLPLYEPGGRTVPPVGPYERRKGPWRVLEPEELRLRTWAALLHGAQGLDWFAHHSYEGGTQPFARAKDMAPLSWSELRGLLAEIHYLTPALCAPEQPGVAVSPDMVDVMRRDVNGKVYVLACPSYWYFKGTLGHPDKTPTSDWTHGWDWEPGPEGRLAIKMSGAGHSARWYHLGKVYHDLKPGDKLLQEVYIEPGSQLDCIEINFMTSAMERQWDLLRHPYHNARNSGKGNFHPYRYYTSIRGWQRPWNNFAFWGAPGLAAQMTEQSKRNPVHLRVGDLPEAGKWVTLEVDANDVGAAGADFDQWHHGRRWLVQPTAGGQATVWWGRGSIRRADGRVIEAIGPTRDGALTFTVEGLKPTSKVVSLLDGQELPVLEGGRFRHRLFDEDENWLFGRAIGVYEITP